MVYVAGGFADFAGAETFNLPLLGYNYFSISNKLVDSHAFSLIFCDDHWRVVDPTIYNTTFHNPDIPAGVEARAYHPSIRNYHIIRKSAPPLEFLDRDRMKTASSSNEKLKIKMGMRDSESYYVQLPPRVDVKSIKVFKINYFIKYNQLDYNNY